MTNASKLFLIILPLFFALSSCDAVVHIFYTVENKTNDKVELFVPNYSVGPLTSGEYGGSVDTVIIIEPNQSKAVGYGSKIDFPWARKRIYKYKPGICGIKQINLDTMVTFECTKKEWSYRKGRSILKIK